MKYQKWNIGAPREEDVAALREAGYPYLMAVVLAVRGIASPETAAEFLDRDRKLTLSPMLMKDMDKAVARIQRAIASGETIAVFGDYDAGPSACATFPGGSRTATVCPSPRFRASGTRGPR